MEDVLDYLDARINPNEIDIIESAKSIGINWEMVCARPKARSIFVSEYDAIRVEDMAFLMMTLERIGFRIDPTYLTKALLPDIKSREKKILSGSELEIFSFERCRHKYPPISLITKKGVWTTQPRNSKQIRII